MDTVATIYVNLITSLVVDCLLVIKMYYNAIVLSRKRKTYWYLKIK